MLVIGDKLGLYRAMACVTGAFATAVGSVYATDIIAERFRTGEGFAWGDHHDHVLHRPGRPSRRSRLRDVVTSAGFTSLARVAEAPFNLVLEARP